MSTIAVFLADGFEEVEALTPVDYLRRAGAEVITVGVVGKVFEKTLIVNGSHNIPVIADICFEEYLEKYGKTLPDAVFCPGGLKGSNNLAATEKLLKHIEDCNAAGKLVSAICAAPSLVLGKTNVMKGKKWTCYPGMAEDSNKEYVPDYSDEVFITDGNIVTGRGAGAAEQFAMELVRILQGADTAKKVHDGTVQR
ncbi:MAG: DJ-1 family glyoxalase III [Treponema sp.]|nr:DJ-1 family glyoxalase III [Treponema sp.]MDY5123547.1 DJ-1 family glyoxalase III [Treponema sp.]